MQKTIGGIKEGDINVGDIVRARGRAPMPEAMKKAFEERQTVSIAEHPFYEFESGWSVNVEMGDWLFLVTPHPNIPNRNYRRRLAKAQELTERSNIREMAIAKKKRDDKAMNQALALRRAERKRLRKAGLLYPKKKPNAIAFRPDGAVELVNKKGL